MTTNDLFILCALSLLSERILSMMFQYPMILTPVIIILYMLMSFDQAHGMTIALIPIIILDLTSGAAIGITTLAFIIVWLTISIAKSYLQFTKKPILWLTPIALVLMAEFVLVQSRWLGLQFTVHQLGPILTESLISLAITASYLNLKRQQSSIFSRS